MVATMDNRGRSRLFGCFNSSAQTQDVDESSSDPVAPPPSPPLTSSPPPSSSSCDEKLRWRKAALRNLSGSLKSAFFKAPFLKKLKSKKPLRREYYRSISSLSSKLKRPVKKLTPAKAYSEPDELIESDDSDHHYSLFSPTSAASSCASSVSSLEPENARISDTSLDLPLVVAGTSYDRHNAIKNADGGMKFKYSAAATGVCMFLVCLVALVFWGKAIAVVTCTSAWLFLAANYRRTMVGHGAAKKEVLAVNDAVLDSEEDKKRVIMEGILDRSRPRFIQQ